ncbi:MAG TPA: response regulator [Flavitalea sp.]|nr:response regulator [Flavitalea sp.]
MTKESPIKHLVVYADDDPDDLDLVEEAFSQYSVHVDLIKFQNGEEALDYLRNHLHDEIKPCLIILDINMPGMSGKEVLIRLRGMDRFLEIPVVMFTTSSSSKDIEFARRHKAGFITKPLDISQMELIAEKFIDHCAEDIRKKIRTEIK